MLRRSSTDEVWTRGDDLQSDGRSCSTVVPPLESGGREGSCLGGFSCMVIERSYTKGTFRRGRHYEKRIMVICVRVSDKLKMMRQESEVGDLSKAGHYRELWAWCRGQQGQALHLKRFTTKLEKSSRRWLQTGLPVLPGRKRRWGDNCRIKWNQRAVFKKQRD